MMTTAYIFAIGLEWIAQTIRIFLALTANQRTEVTAMRLIDRDAIHWRPDENWELYATAADIRAIPTVDAVGVTRCKDCRSCRELNRKDRVEDAYAEGVLWCMNQSNGVWPDDFCSYGEPKEG